MARISKTLGHIYIGQKELVDGVTSNIDINGDESENDSTPEKAKGPANQLRVRQAFGPTSNDQGRVGNICWGVDPDTGDWCIFVKVLKDGDKGKQTKRDWKGQWYKIPLLPHRPDKGSDE